MEEERKKQLKAQFKQNERDALRASLPMGIDDLKDLLSFLGRETAPECDHTLREAIEFLKSRKLDPAIVVPWLNKHGGYCDCEVIYNVYDAVGDIIGWHLEKNA